MKILIKGANWIGDAVMSIPALRRTRMAFPDASIALHTRRWAEGVFRDAGIFDEIISYDPSGSKMRTVIEQAKVLRRHSFDAAVLLPNSFESAMTVGLAGIPRRFGYRTDGRRILLTDSLPVPEWKSVRHESEFYSNLADLFIKSMGGEAGSAPTETSLTVSLERKSGAINRLASFGMGYGFPVVAIGAGSTNSMAKRWPAEYFAKLCENLSSSFDAEIVLLGAANEADVGAELLKLTDAKLLDLIGKTDLSEATATLAIVDLFVSNDMGLAHIAASLGTPTLTIFGPTNETATAPLGPNARFVREVVECSPCMLRECPIDHRCMTRLTPERVFEVASEMLNPRIAQNDRDQS